MFTGIVVAGGKVVAIAKQGDGRRVTFSHPELCDELSIGASIAVNGCCLTVTSILNDQFTADLVPETVSRTNLGELKAGDFVNLELPMGATGRFDGHFVQGHIDGTGKIKACAKLDDGSYMIEVGMSGELAPYLIEKGSITVDGVSLTVVSVSDQGFSFAMIPHTADVTTLGKRTVGDAVNLEVDLLAKYVERRFALQSENIR